MMRQRLLSLLMLAALSQGVLFLPLQAAAQELQWDAGFDPNHILEDEDIFDVHGMSYDRMVSFLRSKGTLAEYRTPDIDGVPKTVPEIIWRVANSYKINPKYLLALIQKEQSLVESLNPSQKQFDWAAGYGVCDSCSKDDPAIQNFKGFAAQLEWAAKQHREKYLLQILSTGTTRAGKAAGKSMNVDGAVVIPANNATAMLYSYTPHIHGNLNLWRIWQRWFTLTYPDGTVVRAKGSGLAFLIRLGQKRKFASPTVFTSLVDANKVVSVSDTELSAYPDGPVIRFPKYALLRDSKKGIWLLTDSERRAIADMKTFRKFDFNEDEIIDVKDADLADYPVGAAITQKTEFPQGMLVREKDTKNYWYVESGVRQPIPARAYLSLYFSGRTAKVVTAKKLATYTLGQPYALHNAELVRGTTVSSVFVVENQLLRPIPSGEVFEAMGWNWKNVVLLPDSVIAAYKTSDPIELRATAPATTLTQLPSVISTSTPSTILGNL